MSTGTWQHLALTFNSDSISAAINGTTVGTVTNSSYSSGMAGFGTSGYQTDQFDNPSVTPRPVIYAAVWRSSRNCHHARAPSAAALVTCAALAAVAASALAVQSAWSASRSACTSQNATPAPSIP